MSIPTHPDYIYCEPNPTAITPRWFYGEQNGFYGEQNASFRKLARASIASSFSAAHGANAIVSIIEIRLAIPDRRVRALECLSAVAVADACEVL